MPRISVSSARAAASWLTAAALTLSAGRGLAQPDDATRNAARELAAQAGEAFQRKEFAVAADLYRRAHALVGAPSLSVREGRALEQLGRLVEASEAYVRTTRFRLTDDSPRAFQEAVQEANSALSALRPRIPKLTLALGGPGAKSPDLVVLLNGKPLPAALIGVPAPIDPGKHEIVVRGADGKELRRSVDLTEGQARTLTLEVASGGAVTAREQPSDASGSKPAVAPSKPALVWIAGGVGVAGLGVGIVGGVLATGRHSDATAACPNLRCAPGSAGQDDVDAFRTLRTVSTVGYVVGVVGLGTAAALWLTAPKERGVALAVGPASATLRGAF
ncbi:MAG: hypothetical protein KF718_28990 [Polyangiaceae bacterium]|nr:hypothetical protein [Polyangiaceae bacterium]